MATFRVYLARPTTPEGIRDFAETVVAPDAQIALGYAYATWVGEHPHPAPPPLSQCRRRVNTIGQSVSLAAVAAVTPGQQAFAQAIQQQTADFLSTQLDGEFSLVSYPAGFNYGITWGANAWWNAATLQDIDTLLSTSSSGGLELNGSRFSTLYGQILQSVTFTFSQADTKRMNAQDNAASAQVSAVITEYKNAGGTLPPNPPFGGYLQYVFNDLSQQFGGLDKIPDSLNALRNAIASYKAAAGDSYALHNRYYAATARIAASKSNTTTPNSANGGMQTDANAWSVGWTPDKLPTANQLIGSLSTTSNAVKISVSMYDFTGHSSQVQVSGGAGFSIPIADILGLSIGGSASYDLSKYASASTNVTMELDYPGITLVGTAPTPLSTDNRTGWYANDIITEVAAKTGLDVTGYQMQGTEFDPKELFGPGKAFSRLKTFVISQQPTIVLTFTGVDAKRVASDFQVNASAKLDLFGLFTIGQVSGSYQVQDVQENVQQGQVIVTFGPPNVSGTIPLQSQVAYVLGGVASYPPDNI